MLVAGCVKHFSARVPLPKALTASATHTIIKPLASSADYSVCKQAVERNTHVQCIKNVREVEEASNLMKPSEESRLAVRERPSGGALMYQSWVDLLFLHWKFKASVVQELLPNGLFVDTFDGDAFVGVVPFFMKNIRFRGTPSVPWVSNFMELNLRTYVFDKNGQPGVWFFSLDCNQPLAVWAARTLFHLPYQHASMRSGSSNGSSSIEYTSTRCSKKKSKNSSRFDYTYKATRSYAQPGTLEFFLVERYLLFATNRRGGISSGQVHHVPYPLWDMEVSRFETDLFEQNGLPIPVRPFDHAIGSRGVDVEVFPLRPNGPAPSVVKVHG